MGKEKDQESSLGDFGVRKYDDEIGRFTSIDPLTEKMPAWSPYVYSFNSPLVLIDPNGRFPGDYYDVDGNHLGNDEIDDDKVYIVEGASEFNIKNFQEGGKYFENHAAFNENNGSGFSVTEWKYSIQASELAEYMPTLLSHEGGFVNHPNDPGGATNKGITFNTFKKYSQDVLGVKPTLGNLKRLSDNQAAAIYEVGYWNPSRAGNISDKQLGWLHFDTYLHGGASSVLRGTTSSLGVSNSISGLNNAIQTYGGANAFDGYKRERLRRFDRIIANNPQLGVFRQGWINRVNRFQYQTP